MAKKTVSYKDTDTYKRLLIVAHMNRMVLADEFKFHETRKWRADFALLAKEPTRYRGIIIEVEGGLWIQGRHNHPVSVQKDLEKYNEAAKYWYLLLRYTPQQWKAGKPVDDVKELINAINYPYNGIAER